MTEPMTWGLEALEPRLLLAATPAQIAAALDLPANATVTYTGDSQAVLATSDVNVGGLLGFPTGLDSDFLVLSTGIAAQARNANSSGNQGTDLGDPGVNGDTATISIRLPVPASSRPQRFRFDFMFLSEEYPEFVGSNFNDFFTATVNGQNIALDQNGNPVSINNVFFDGSLSTQGTMFDGRTAALTAAYRIEPGTTHLDIVLSIGDLGDGRYDSAVFLDNFRITPQQLVHLNFDGKNAGRIFGIGTNTVIPPFQPSDFGSDATRQQLINLLLLAVQEEYAAYDIEITATKPEVAVYTEIIIGGGANTPVTIDAGAREIYEQLAAKYNLGPLPANPIPVDVFEHLLGIPQGDEIWGRSEAVDIGNRKPNDRAIIMPGRIAPQTTDLVRIREVAEIIAHELGHLLGLLHVEDQSDMMFFGAQTNSDEAFRNRLMQRKSDEITPDQQAGGFTHQNDHQYLLAILGSSSPGSTGSLAATFHGEALSTNPSYTFALGTKQPIYNAVIGTHKPGQHFSGQITTQPLLQGQTTIPLTGLGPDTQLFFFASSTPNGPMDLVLGQFNGNSFSIDTDLFIGNSLNGTFAIGKITGSGVVPFTTGTLEKSATVGPLPDNVGNTVAAAFNLGANGKLVPPAGLGESIGNGDNADFYKLVLKSKSAARTTITLSNLTAPIKFAYGLKNGNKFTPIKQVSASGPTARLKINSGPGKQTIYLRVTPGTPASAAALTDYLMSIKQKKS